MCPFSEGSGPSARGSLLISPVLMEVLGASELADDERFATVGNRNDNREELRPLLLELLSKKSADEWFNDLTAAGVDMRPINDIRGGVQLAERLGLEPVVEIDGIPTVRNPVRFSKPLPATSWHRQQLAPPATTSASG